MNKKALEKQANEIRKTILNSIYHAGSGHPGGSLSITDVLTYLYFYEMNVNPENPSWDKRDRLVMSKGHGAPALYATLAHRGYFSVNDVMDLRKLNSKFQGHPCMNKVSGVEMSTGSLGQGFSVSVGMALADKIDNNERRIFTILGDGELQEGIVWEAAMSVAHYSLSNLTVIIDNNGLQIDGKNSDVMTITPILEKFSSFGFDVIEIDGHDFESICNGLEFAKASSKPVAILAKTVKGKGVSFMENQAGWHGKAPSKEELDRALEELEGGLDNER